MRWLRLVVVVPFLPACSSGDEGSPSDPSDPTYHEHVAPIVADNCYRCHHEGGIAPFELRTYDQVRAAGPAAAHATRERIMPPWLADNSGSCQTFKDASWLDQADIDTISRWVESGMAEGDTTAEVSFELVEDHVDATLVLTPSEPYTPNVAQDDDDYRCFVVDTGLTSDQYLTEYEVLPDNAEVVHHVIVYNPTSDAAAENARQLDAAEAGPGYTCFGGPIADATVAAAWAPGRARWAYPSGMGVPIRAGRAQIVQVHYHVHAGDTPPADQSSVALKLVPQVEQELLPWFYADTALSLAPGRELASARLETSTALYMDAAGTPAYAAPMTLVGVGPHMHKRGISERLELAKADGSGTSCLLDVPRWDFNWQFAYFFETPVRVMPDDLLRMTCRYDTRGETNTVTWGEGTDDEMCLVLMYSVFDDGRIPGSMCLVLMA